MKQLRKLTSAAARELFEAEQTIKHMESETHSLDHLAGTAAAQIAAAALARATLAARAVRELKRLMPAAITQARRGKPALLRMILRATR